MIENGWWVEAQALPSPNFNTRPPVDINLLVIHNISLPPAQFGTGNVQRFFQNTLNCDEHPYFETIKDLHVSSHIYIERDGGVVQFVPFGARAWHAGESIFNGIPNCNDYSIGIELEGCDDVPYEEDQYHRLVELSEVLMAAYPGITPDRIVGHCDIAPGRKTDPGGAFDWNRYKNTLKERREG
ncbi:MAG: 1,6-anhydro-N-acetylmuramyl-L-alanine amidase AmpD [Agarilytica sp.]